MWQGLPISSEASHELCQSLANAYLWRRAFQTSRACECGVWPSRWNGGIFMDAVDVRSALLFLRYTSFLCLVS